jgi:hypothetical protein
VSYEKIVAFATLGCLCAFALLTIIWLHQFDYITVLDSVLDACSVVSVRSALLVTTAAAWFASVISLGLLRRRVIWFDRGSFALLIGGGAGGLFWQLNISFIWPGEMGDLPFWLLTPGLHIASVFLFALTSGLLMSMLKPKRTLRRDA